MALIWFKEVVGMTLAVTSVTVLAFNPLIVGSATQVRSEALFLMLAFGCLLLMREWSRDNTWRGLLWLVLTIICAVYATAVRSIGLVLILTVLVASLVFGRSKHIPIILLLTCLLYAPLANFMIRQGGTAFSPSQLNQSQIFWWTSQPLILFPHMLANLERYAMDLLPTVLTALIGPQLLALADRFSALMALIVSAKITLLGLVSFGFIETVRSAVEDRRRISERTSVVFVLLYSAVMLVFYDANQRRHHAQVRYLIPLMPFIVVFLMRGWSILCRNPWVTSVRWSRRVGKSFFYGLVALFVSVYIGRNVANIVRPNAGNIPDIALGADWIRANTASDALVACDDPVPRYLYLRRNTIGYSTSESISTRLTDLDRQQVDYVLVAPRLRVGNAGNLDSDQEEFLSVLRNRRERYHLVFEDATHRAYVFSRIAD